MKEFDEAGRMKPSAYYERLVDVMEELVKFTLLTRDVSGVLTDRYSERREAAVKLEIRAEAGRGEVTAQASIGRGNGCARF